MLCLTVKASLEFYNEAVDIFYSEHEDLSTTDAITCLNISAITANTIRSSNNRGGNPCGWAETEQSSK